MLIVVANFVIRVIAIVISDFPILGPDRSSFCKVGKSGSEVFPLGKPIEKGLLGIAFHAWAIVCGSPYILDIVSVIIFSSFK